MPPEQRIRILTPEQAVADIATPASPIGTALSNTINGKIPAVGASFFAPNKQPAKFVVMGDSNSETSNNNQNWHAYLGALCDGRAIWAGYYATATYTLSQIRSVHLPSVLALTGYNKPGMCIIAGGTNPNDPTGLTTADQLAVLKDICAQLEAASIEPVLVSIPPRHDGADATAQTAINSYVRRWNATVTALATSRGYRLLPWFKAMVDTATGLMKPTHQTGDNIHFSQVGHAAIAAASAPALIAGLPAQGDFILTTDEKDTANKVSYPRMAVSGGRLLGVNGDANVAFGWSILSTGTVEVARLADAADPAFFWQEMENATTSILAQQTDIPVIPGNRIAITGLLRLPEGLLDSTVTWGPSFEFRTAANGSAGFVQARDVHLGQAKANLGTGSLFLYVEATVPVGAASMRYNVQISKGRIGYSRATVRDLTALGIV